MFCGRCSVPFLPPDTSGSPGDLSPFSFQVGDPQEVNGIVSVFCQSKRDPLLIGSTKSNMGHPEPASGLSALAKVRTALC